MLSVILPSIRPFLLEKFYASLLGACQGIRFELIVISPYELPHGLKNDDRIRLIPDKGSPSRALQIGLVEAKGDYVTTISDDSIMTPLAYTNAVNKFMTMSPINNRMLVLAFREGSIGEFIRNNEYHFFQAWYHPDLRVEGLPKNAPMALQFIIDRQTLLDIGGWDCINYQCGNWGGHDMTGRLMNRGIVFEYMQGHTNQNTWAPGIDGLYNDHRPVWESSEHGMPVFKAMWAQPNTRINIDLNNWKQSPAVWKLRFKE